jgi:hypothetical protein
MAKSIILSAFYVVGAVLVSYAGYSVWASVTDMLSRIPVVR